MFTMERYLHLLSRGDKIGLTLIRLSIAIVLCGLVIKVCPLRGRQHYTIRRKQSTNVVLL